MNNPNPNDRSTTNPINDSPCLGKRAPDVLTMTLPDLDLENRRPVWLALSELFLDTELEDHNLSYIARTLTQAPYSFTEIETILYQEVYPVCILNLGLFPGAWDGFDEEWLEESILKHLNRKWTIRNIFQLKRFMIRDDWNRVTALYSRHHSQHSDIDDRQDT